MNTTEHRNQESTIWIGNLTPDVSEELLWELMVQAGPVSSIALPRDKVTGQHPGYAFCEYRSEMDAEYAIKVMNMVKLFNNPIRLNKTTKGSKTQESGATLFVGNLDPSVDDKVLYDTFCAFGVVLGTKVMSGVDGSKGFGFVTFDSFDSADTAINVLNNQYLCNRPILVSYAYKKDGTRGEKHGNSAERLLAASRLTQQRPHTRFSDGTQAPEQQPPGLPGTLSITGTNLPPGLGGAPTEQILPTTYGQSTVIPVAPPHLQQYMPPVQGIPSMPPFQGIPPMPPVQGMTPQITQQLPIPFPQQMMMFPPQFTFPQNPNIPPNLSMATPPPLPPVPK